MQYETKFGSLENFEKGGVEVIDDDPRNYAFSNVYEVASTARPYAKTAVAVNREYVLEAVRAEGSSGWRTCAHDEFALVMDGEVTVELVKLDDPAAYVAPDAQGSVALDREPQGPRMGRIVARRGHMALLPAASAYRFHAERPGVLLIQTITGPDTEFRWAETIQTTA